jgi:hypothetical protein
VKITIRWWTGSEFARQEIDAAPCGVPGLAIHAAYGTEGWIITHVPSGMRAAWFLDVSPEWVLGCARELGELGDWTGMPDAELRRNAYEVIVSYGAIMTDPSAPLAARQAEWARALGGAT